MSAMQISLVIIVVALSLISPTFGNEFGEHRPEVIKLQHGAVATDDRRCSRIGRAVLKEGGHAVDATVASVLCLGVVSSASSGIGGGAFMLLRLANGKAQAFDSRETAPLRAYEFWFLEHTTVHAPAASKSRPRFLRWGCDIMYNEAEASSLFDRLEDVNILNSFEGITNEERSLLDTSPQHADANQDETLTSPQTLPNLQISLHKPRRYVVSSPSGSKTPPSPFRPPSPDSNTQGPVSSPPRQQPTTPLHDSLQEGISKIIAQNKVILKRLVLLESRTCLLERRVDAIEHHVFDQKEKDSRFEGMEKFMAEQFPTSMAEQFSTRTVTEERSPPTPINQDEVKGKTLPDPLPAQPDPLPEVQAEVDVIDSKCSTGIARRVRRRVDRKPKEVQSPFTTGQNKKRTRTKKAVARPPPPPPPPPPPLPATALINVDTVTSPEARPAPTEIEYGGRPLINENMRKFIDDCLKMYTDKGDIIYSAGNIHIFRSQIDELLTDQYLDNNHIDAFAILLFDKKKLHPNLYQPFIHVSSLHWGSTQYKFESKQYVSHVNKESVRAANLLLMPVSDKGHWTLLVADLRSTSWTFYDSLPNPIHKAVLPEVINHLHEETDDCFESDIRTWPLTVASGVPTQKNGYDCGMFVCKYMEYTILANPVKWEEQLHWQDDMPKFRAELAYEILCKMPKYCI